MKICWESTGGCHRCRARWFRGAGFRGSGTPEPPGNTADAVPYPFIARRRATPTLLLRILLVIDPNGSSVVR
jgi:hypothetical protein